MIGNLLPASDADPTEPGDTNPFARAAQVLEQRMAEHEVVRSSDAYRGAMTYMWRLNMDFVVAVRAAAIAFTRYPDSEKWLLQSSMDDYMQSAITIVSLGQQGVFNVGRRELRYMLESAAKCVYVDQQLPGATPLNERIAFVADPSKVARSSIDAVDHLNLRLLPDPNGFTSAVHSTFGALSSFTHVSETQLQERQRRWAHGELVGFEGPATLDRFNKIVAQAYDLILALIFEGIGPSFTGDLFVSVFDSHQDWKFHKGRYVREISKFFDYKAERQRSRF